MGGSSPTFKLYTPRLKYLHGSRNRAELPTPLSLHLEPWSCASAAPSAGVPSPAAAPPLSPPSPPSASAAAGGWLSASCRAFASAAKRLQSPQRMMSATTPTSTSEKPPPAHVIASSPSCRQLPRGFREGARRLRRCREQPLLAAQLCDVDEQGGAADRGRQLEAKREQRRHERSALTCRKVKRGFGRRFSGAIRRGAALA